MSRTTRIETAQGETAQDEAPSAISARSGMLPPIGSTGYHILLGAVGLFLLGPLGGITAAYMNFSLGFFVGGQVLAGILGSAVTLGYGPEGRHGANYIQTLSASVASMGAMGVLIQAMVWLGLAEPPTVHLVLYFLCVGMLGAGLGMLYTPLLVDRMHLTFPSGLAVANILRALTDARLLRQSVARLGGGMGLGVGTTLLTEKGMAPLLANIGFGASTFGAGIIVGARIGVPAIVVGYAGLQLTPWLREIGLLGPNDPWRKVGFLLSLGTILGAAIVDVALILRQAARRATEVKAMSHGVASDKGQGGMVGIVLWVAFWSAAVVTAASVLFAVPLAYALMGVGLGFVFVLVNGISLGISDQNPISSAFVVSVTLMAAAGLTDPLVGLIAGSILLVTTAVGGDMQQDRSTGWRMGSSRRTQFRYQVVGVIMGAVFAVVVTKLFLAAYPVLTVDTFAHPELKVDKWQSAMTYKFVGVLRGLTSADSTALKLMLLGIVAGIAIETVRKWLKASAAYQSWKTRSAANRATDFVLDAVIVPSPYASSFGGFVDWTTALWFGLGGVLSSTWDWAVARFSATRADAADVPSDMSAMSLLGGGLIAGEALAFLALGVIGLLTLVA